MTLTPTEQEELRIAIAEEMGWKYQPYRSGEPATWIRPNGNPVGHTLKELPYYTSSIDAIQAACLERLKIKSERDSFDMQLADMTRGESHIYQLTALDWCIAFARVRFGDTKYDLH